MEKRIIVIEDEPELQQMLRDALGLGGYMVLSAGDADLARTLIQACEPDLILVDLRLPGVSGTELAAALRAAGLGHTPMVAMSADRLQLMLAERSGLFQDILVKPFELQELLDLVEAHAGQYIPAAYVDHAMVERAALERSS